VSGDAESRIALGQRGEDLAEQFLRRAGFKIVARHYSTPVGELDLIARDKDTVVFVEVKTRSDQRLADPHEAVGPTKQRRMTRAARWFLRQQRCEDRPCRFDIVSVVVPEGGRATIEHFRDAFLPQDRS
jgi:putative endonuclease